MLAVAKGVAEQTWPHTMDAAVWAAEFVKRYPGSEFSEGDMIGWFVNAIMAGYDTAQSVQSVTRTPQEPKKVVAWLHQHHSTAYVITDTIKQLWLKAKPQHVKNYTVPLYFGDTLGDGK